MAHSQSGINQDAKVEKEKPCRSCTDFKSWMSMQSRKKMGDANQENSEKVEKELHSSNIETLPDNCPLDVEQLGRNSWSFLHTMASNYPENPNKLQESDMSKFIKLFSQFYPCHHCAKDLRESIKKAPPKTKSRYDLSQWMCQLHNEVNVKLGKPEFDCKLVDERWLNGWKDGSCG